MSRARKQAPQAPPPRSPETGGRSTLAGLAGLAVVLVLGAIAYSSSLNGDFVFDDLGQIAGNKTIEDLGWLLSPAGWRVMPNRYVAYVSFAVSHALFGYQTTGWHVTNLLIHLANAALLWGFVRLAFRTPRLRSSALAPASGALAFAAAALFVAHPLATQAVSYVVQRITSLATLFSLLAVVLWMAWRLREGHGRWLLYGAMLLSSLLAVRTKEITFTLPLMLALVEWTFFEGGWRRLLPVLPVVAFALLIPLTVLDLGRPATTLLSSADQATRVQTTAAISRLDYLRTESIVIARYLGMLVVPVGQSIDHYVEIRRSWLALDVAGATLLILALWGLATWLGWRSTPRGGRPPLDPAVRLVAFGIAWFFLGLAVESSFIPIVDVMNEHRTYLPMAGLWPGVAAALGLLFVRLDRPHVARDLAAVAGVLSCVLGVVTWNRNLVWQSDLALWKDASEKVPEHERTLRKLGAAYFQQNRFPEAVDAFRRHQARFPQSIYSRVQLGVALAISGRPAEGEAVLRQAAAMAPDDPEPTFNLAFLLVRTGQREAAQPVLERMLRIETDPEKIRWARTELAR